MTPLVSFIVSAWKRPMALNLCLLSLINQSEDRWEAIVTDNSTDEDIIAKHKDVCSIDDRIHYLNTAEEGGLCCYSSAEIGVRYAKGEWLGFPSDDSIYMKYYTSKLLRLAKEKDLELVYCDLVMEGVNDGGILSCAASACLIDKTNFLVKKSRFIPFPDKRVDSASDGPFIDELVKQGIKHGKVGHPLAVHS